MFQKRPMFGNNNPVRFNRPPPHGIQYGRYYLLHNPQVNENYESRPNYPPSYGNYHSFQQNRYQHHPSGQSASYEGQQPAFEHQQIWPQEMNYLPIDFQSDGFPNQFPPNGYMPNFNEPWFGRETPHPNSSNAAVNASGGMPLYNRNTASRGNYRRSRGSFYGLYTSFEDMRAPILLPVPFSNEEGRKVHDLIDLTGDDEHGTFSSGTIEQESQQNLCDTPIVEYFDDIISDENSSDYDDTPMVIDDSVIEVQSQELEEVISLDSESSDHSLVSAPQDSARDSVLCYGNKQVYVSVIKANPSRAPSNKCCNENSEPDILTLEEGNHLSREKIIYIDCNNNSGEEEETLSAGNYQFLDKTQSTITSILQGTFRNPYILQSPHLTVVFLIMQIRNSRRLKTDSSILIFSPYVYHVSVDLHFFSFSLHTHSESFVTKLGNHEVNICAVGNLLHLLAESSGASKANKLFSFFVREIRNIFFYHEKLLLNKVHWVLPKLELKNHMDELLNNNVSPQRGNVDETNNTSLQKSHLKLKKTALLKKFNDKCAKPGQALERGIGNLQCLTNEISGMVVGGTSGMYLVRPTSIAKAKQILKLKYVYIAEPPLRHENQDLLFTKLHIGETECLGKKKHVFEITRTKTCPKHTPCMKEQEQYRVSRVEEEQSLKLLFTKENSKNFKFVAPSQLKEKTLHMVKTETGFKYVGQEPVQYVLKKLDITHSASQSSVKEARSNPVANSKMTNRQTMKGSPKEDERSVKKAKLILQSAKEGKRSVKKAKLILIRESSEMLVKPVVDCIKADVANDLKNVNADKPDKIEKCISDSRPLICDMGNKGIGQPSAEKKAVTTSKQVLVSKERNSQFKPISRLLDKVKTELDKSIEASTSSMVKICNNIQYIIKNSQSVTVHEFLHQGLVISDNAGRKILKHFCKESNVAVCDIIHTYMSVRKNLKGSLSTSANRKKIKEILERKFKNKKWGQKAIEKRLALLHKILSFHQNCKVINQRATENVSSKITAEIGPPDLQLAEQSDAEILIDSESPPRLEPEVAVAERFPEFNPVVPIISNEEGYNIHTDKSLLLDVELNNEDCSLSQNSFFLSSNVIDSNEQLGDLSRGFAQSKHDLGKGSNDCTTECSGEGCNDRTMQCSGEGSNNCTIQCLGEGSNDCVMKCSGEELNKEENSLATEIVAVENLLKLESEKSKNHASEEYVSNGTPALDESLKEIEDPQQTGTVNESLPEESADKSVENQTVCDKKSKTVISLKEYELRQPFRSYHSTHHDQILSPQWIPPSPWNDSSTRRNSNPNVNQRPRSRKHCSVCCPRPCKACKMPFAMHINGRCKDVDERPVRTHKDPALFRNYYSTISSSHITNEDVDALKNLAKKGDIFLYDPEEKHSDPRLRKKEPEKAVFDKDTKYTANYGSDTDSLDSSGRKRARSNPRAEDDCLCCICLGVNLCDNSDDSVSSPEFESHLQLPFETHSSAGETSASRDLQTHGTLDFELGVEASTSLGVISQSEIAYPLKKKRRGEEPYNPDSPTSTISTP